MRLAGTSAALSRLARSQPILMSARRLIVVSSNLPTGRGVDFVQKAAGPGCQELRMSKTRFTGQLLPTLVGEGIRNPIIAPVNIVLNQNQAAAGAEVTPDSLNYLPLPCVLVKMKGISHNNSI